MSGSIQSTSATSLARHSGWPVIRPGRGWCAAGRSPGSGSAPDSGSTCTGPLPRWSFTPPPDLPEAAIQASAGDRRGTAQFTAGRNAGNRLDPDCPVETRLVTIHSPVEGRHVASMTVDVEGFEIDVLRGCTRALSERRIGPIRLKWNAMSQLALGADRRPVADLLAKHGYQLFRPDPQGRLVAVTDPGLGADVLPVPQMKEATRDVRTFRRSAHAHNNPLDPALHLQPHPADALRARSRRRLAAHLADDPSAEIAAAPSDRGAEFAAGQHARHHSGRLGPGLMKAGRPLADPGRAGREERADPDGQAREAFCLFETKAAGWRRSTLRADRWLAAWQACPPPSAGTRRPGTESSTLGAAPAISRGVLATAGLRVAGCDISGQMLVRAAREAQRSWWAAPGGSDSHRAGGGCRSRPRRSMWWWRRACLSM